MASTIYGMQNYYSAFVSPLKSYEVSPVTSLMYGAKASKLYSQTAAKKLHSSMSSYLSSMNSVVSSLKTASKELASNGPGSSFSQKAVTSDNSAVSGTAEPNADVQSYTLNVSLLAQAQNNAGKILASSEKSFEAGLNSISVKVGNSDQRKISFMIDEKDTNLTSLNKMASAINSSKLGITASVTSDSKTGTSFLSIVSDKTGTANAFSIEDVTGKSAEITGITAVKTVAQNAAYTLDGKEYTSQQNTISADNGKVRISFNKAEGKDIKVRVGTDISGIKDDIENFVRSYNSVISFVNANSSKISGAELLQKELSGITHSRYSSLQSIGISTASDGKLSIDEEKLDSALSNNLSRVKDIFSGYNGLADKAMQKSNEVLQSPVKYARPNENSRDVSSFYNYMNGRSSTSSRNNIYSGMIFDMLL